MIFFEECEQNFPMNLLDDGQRLVRGRKCQCGECRLAVGVIHHKYGFRYMALAEAFANTNAEVQFRAMAEDWEPIIIAEAVMRQFQATGVHRIQGAGTLDDHVVRIDRAATVILYSAVASVTTVVQWATKQSKRIVFDNVV